MKIVTMAQHAAEKMRGYGDWHIISLRSPGNSAATLGDQWGKITYVAVADDDFVDRTAVRKIAKAVADAHNARVTGLLIHCEMGVSRSVGAARAVAATYELPYENEFLGNQRLKRALMSALSEHTGATP